MKAIAVIVFLVCSISEACISNSNCDSQLIVGSWFLDHIIYKGEERPPFNPDLEIMFDFDAMGESHLFWFRNNEVGFCERKGVYKYESCGLTDTVTWLNPLNLTECGLDPDMQLGHTTITYVDMDGNDFLRLHLQMGEEELIYVLRRVKNIRIQES